MHILSLLIRVFVNEFHVFHGLVQVVCEYEALEIAERFMCKTDTPFLRFHVNMDQMFGQPRVITELVQCLFYIER